MVKKIISISLIVCISLSLSACNGVDEDDRKATTVEDAVISYLEGCAEFDFDKIDRYSVLDHKTDTLISIDNRIEGGDITFDDGKTYPMQSQEDVYAFWSERSNFEKICKNYDEYKVESSKAYKNQAKEKFGEYKITVNVDNITDMTPNEVDEFIDETTKHWKRDKKSAELSDIIDFSQVEEYKEVHGNTIFESEKQDDSVDILDGIVAVKINNFWKIVNTETYLLLTFNLN